jgi:hypothetical protein
MVDFNQKLKERNMVKGPMKTPKNGAVDTQAAQEAIVEDLRKTVNSLDTTIAIYKNDMSRALQALKVKYGTDTVEEALAKADGINQEMADLEKSKNNLLAQIRLSMQKYSNEALGR